MRVERCRCPSIRGPAFAKPSRGGRGDSTETVAQAANASNITTGARWSTGSTGQRGVPEPVRVNVTRKLRRNTGGALFFG